MTKRLIAAAVTTIALAGNAFGQAASTGTATSTTTARAQGTVSNLPGDGAVKGDTKPKPDPSGQKAREYKDNPKPLRTTAPPPPTTKPK